MLSSVGEGAEVPGRPHRGHEGPALLPRALVHRKCIKDAARGRTLSVGRGPQPGSLPFVNRELQIAPSERRISRDGSGNGAADVYRFLATCIATPPNSLTDTRSTRNPAASRAAENSVAETKPSIERAM